jgi:hypothetical protein
MHIMAQWCFCDEFFAMFGLFEEKFGKMAHWSFLCGEFLPCTNFTQVSSYYKYITLGPYWAV